MTYLGPDLPVAELLAAARDTGARAVALSIVYSFDDERLWRLWRRLAGDCPGGRRCWSAGQRQAI